MVDRVGTRHEVAATEPEEQQSRQGPGEDRETEPLRDLAKIVRTRHVLIHTFLRQVMVRIARLAQMADHVVRMHIDDPSREEDERTEDETRIEEP